MILSRDGTFAQLMSTSPKKTNTEGQTSADLLEMIRDWRGRAERAHLEQMWRDDIKLKDELFQRFCKLLDQLAKQNDNVYRLLRVKEEWGLWLEIDG